MIFLEDGRGAGAGDGGAGEQPREPAGQVGDHGTILSRMRIRIRSDPVIFGPPDPDPVLLSTDPDPTCINGFIKLFSS